MIYRSLCKQAMAPGSLQNWSLYLNAHGLVGLRQGSLRPAHQPSRTPCTPDDLGSLEWTGPSPRFRALNLCLWRDPDPVS